MKKAILLFVCMATVFCPFAQETPSATPEPGLTKEQFLKKWKRERTGAIVMISAGGVMTLVGMNISLSNSLNNSEMFGVSLPKKDETFGIVLLIAGVATMLASIGVFASARINKRKALSISFKNELSPQLRRSMIFYEPVPSLTLKISL